MTTFGWKRKAGANISKVISSKFEENAKTEDSTDEALTEERLEGLKRRRKDEKENRRLKCEELKTEGVRLAQLNRFEEAVEEFDRALSLAPDEKLLEMKAQALLQLDLPFRALQCAVSAVVMNPRWWVAHQTLGRAQINMGDLQMAKRSFSKAFHLSPWERELWDEDIQWTMELIVQQEKKKKEEEEAAQKKPYII